MPIRFPMMHIAESVMNRIFNAADEIEAREPQQNTGKIDRSAQVQPMAPEPSLQGAMLDQQLAAPAPAMPPAEAPPEPEAGDVAQGIARGGTALSGLLAPGGPLGGGVRPLM